MDTHTHTHTHTHTTPHHTTQHNTHTHTHVLQYTNVTSNLIAWPPSISTMVKLAVTVEGDHRCFNLRPVFPEPVPQGKRAATVQCYPGFFLLCAVFHVSIPPTERPILLQQMDMIFNVHSNLGAGHPHQREIRHKQVCTRRADLEGQKNCFSPPPCPDRGSNPEVFRFEFRLSNH